MSTNRKAIIRRAEVRRVEAYMPSNYTAVQDGEDVIIEGRDNAGWTLDGYVIPRLASGMIFAKEVEGTE